MDELKRQTRALDDDVRGLASKVGGLGDRLNKIDRDKRWIVACLLGIVVLIALVAFVAFRAEKTGRDQEELRNQVLCPLYGLILGGYDPQSRAEGDARRKYEESFTVIREGYAVLHCTSPLVPPRSD